MVGTNERDLREKLRGNTMQHYSSKELDEKINTFLSSKMEKYPDLIHDLVDINNRADARPQKLNWPHSLFPSQLKTSL